VSCFGVVVVCCSGGGVGLVFWLVFWLVSCVGVKLVSCFGCCGGCVVLCGWFALLLWLVVVL